MEIKVLPCKEEQVADCVRISLTSYEYIHEVYTKLLGEEIHDGTMGSWRVNKAKTITEQQRDEKNAVVALADGKIAGFVSYLVHNGVGHVGNNAVDPAFRGNGIAGYLYRNVLDGMRKEGLAYATVHTGLDDGHAAARRAYQKVGFGKNRSYMAYYQKLPKDAAVWEFADEKVMLRAFMADDLAACKEIALEAWTRIHEGYIEQLGKEMHDGVMPNWENELLRELEQQLIGDDSFVLLDAEMIVGFISYKKLGNLGQIGYHAIAPAYRGRGLGEKMYRFLLAKMVTDGTEFARVNVGLEDAQAAARRVCEKAGFAQGLPSIWYYQKL